MYKGIHTIIRELQNSSVLKEAQDNPPGQSRSNPEKVALSFVQICENLQKLSIKYICEPPVPVFENAHWENVFLNT